MQIYDLTTPDAAAIQQVATWGWQVVTCDCGTDGCSGADVMPLWDLRPHAPYDTCWCHPVDDGSGNRVHQAEDGRSDYECARRAPH